MKIYHDGVLRLATSIAATAMGRFEIDGPVSDKDTLRIVRSGEWEIVPSGSLLEEGGINYAE